MTLRAAAEQFTTISAVRESNTCGCVTDSDPDDAALGLLVDMASDALSILSGGKVYGRQTITSYPTRASGYCACSCGCGLDAIQLNGPDPVVSEVKIDGAALDPATYELHSGRDGRWHLVKTATGDRPSSWPSCQSMWRPNTEDDTFSITWTYGVHIDWIIERAAIELVCDFAADDIVKANALPQGTTSANLGGTTIALNARLTLSERLERLQAGDLGPAVSRFMSVYAPQGRRVSEVWAPELDPWAHTVKA